MADLSTTEKAYLENILEMESGYVLGMSNRDFKHEIALAVDKDIEEEKYYKNGGSKAKRLRAFWDIESNFIVAKLIEHFVKIKIEKEKYREEHLLGEADNKKFDKALEIAELLRNRKEDFIDDDINKLASSYDDYLNQLLTFIQDSLKYNRLHAENLDRLHTFLSMFMRFLIERHGRTYREEDTLQRLFKIYREFLDERNLIHSKTTITILKLNASLMDQFNEVRNNKSYAHPNLLLNEAESALLFKHILNIVYFINTIENEIHERLGSD